MKSLVTRYVRALKGRLLLRTRLRSIGRGIVDGIYDFYFDRRAGAKTGGVVETPYRKTGIHSTKSTRYRDLAKLFSAPETVISPGDVLVDVGCGKGRVILWWLMRGVTNPLIGVELTEEVANETRARFSDRPNVTILAGDIIPIVSPNWTYYYMFNPFDKQVMIRFRDRLAAVADRDKLTIIYHRALHLDVFSSTGDWLCTPLPSAWLNPERSYLIRPRT